MLDSALGPPALRDVTTVVPSITDVPTPPGYPRRLEGESLDRLLGRCGRVADTTDPPRYAAVFAAACARFGRRLRYGIMVPTNLVIEGIVYHPVYRQKRTPQMAPLMLFKQHEERWTARSILWVRPESDNEGTAEAEIVSLFADFGVEVLILRPELIDYGYLDTTDFKRRLSRAVYAPCALPPQPLPTPSRRSGVADGARPAAIPRHQLERRR